MVSALQRQNCSGIAGRGDSESEPSTIWRAIFTCSALDLANLPLPAQIES